MRRQTSRLLRSPDIGNSLRLEVFESSEDRVINGRLIDDIDEIWFRIEDGIADLSPLEYRNQDRYLAFKKRFNLHDVENRITKKKPVELALEQIAFFSENREKYESDVVNSPFYETLDKVTLGTWMDGKIKTGMQVLEVGAGTGRQTLPLLAAGASVVGIDLSEDMLRLARNKAFDAGLDTQCDFVVGTAENLPIARNSFDAGIIFGSMHHFMDPPTALKNMGEVLKSGAPFYLLEPHKSPARFIFDWMMRKWQLWEEEAAEDPLFRQEQFQEWLRDAGFASKITYSTYLPPHLFYLFRGAAGRTLLSASDNVFSRIPLIDRFAGVIIGEAVKT